MITKSQDRTVRAGFFASVAQADAAVRNLSAAGYGHDELAVICPDKFTDHFKGVAKAEEPGTNATEGLTSGGAVGATLGGLALAAAAIGTGGIALLPAATVLIGGGAIAGGISGLVLADGYSKGVGEYYEQAIRLSKIVVGVHLEGEDNEARLLTASDILEKAGAEKIVPPT